MAEGEQSSTNSITSSSNPPIIMKVDASTDDVPVKGDENQENNSGKDCTEFKLCSPTVRPSASNLSNNPFANSYNKGFSRGILKPPQLSLNNSNNSSFTQVSTKLNPSAKSPFVLNPSRLNPVVPATPTNSEESPKKTQVCFTADQNGEKTNSISTTNSQTSALPCTSLSTNNSFIFGQNLQDRVKVEGTSDEPKASTSLNSNGTSEMLFSCAAKQETQSDNLAANKETKSLSESAKEYEESRAVKRKYEEVEVKTGEEEETNILSVSCKLFAYDKASGNWQERGRGILRLNDFEVDTETQSRLVFRTSGSLRVILNTKIWAEMTVQKASDKSIRLTALDANGDVRVFLIMASIDDTKQLFIHLQTRLDKEIATQKRKKITDSTKEGSESEVL